MGVRYAWKVGNEPSNLHRDVTIKCYRRKPSLVKATGTQSFEMIISFNPFASSCLSYIHTQGLND